MTIHVQLGSIKSEVSEKRVFYMVLSVVVVVGGGHTMIVQIQFDLNQVYN